MATKWSCCGSRSAPFAVVKSSSFSRSRWPRALVAREETNAETGFQLSCCYAPPCAVALALENRPSCARSGSRMSSRRSPIQVALVVCEHAEGALEVAREGRKREGVRRT